MDSFLYTQIGSTNYETLNIVSGFDKDLMIIITVENYTNVKIKDKDLLLNT